MSAPSLRRQPLPCSSRSCLSWAWSSSPFSSSGWHSPCCRCTCIRDWGSAHSPSVSSPAVNSLPRFSRAYGRAALATITGSYAVALIAARLILGHLPDRIGGARVALICVLIEAAGLALIALAPSALSAAVGAALTGFGYALVFRSSCAVGAPRTRYGRLYGLSRPRSGHLRADTWSYRARSRAERGLSDQRAPRAVRSARRVAASKPPLRRPTHTEITRCIGALAQDHELCDRFESRRAPP